MKLKLSLESLSAPSPLKINSYGQPLQIAYSLFVEDIMLSKVFWTTKTGDNSDSTTMTGLWKSIWSLKCPCKLRNFAQRASENILPTKTQLRERHVPIDVDCDMCDAVETPGHTFWGCDLAKKVWTILGTKPPNSTQEPRDFRDLLWMIRERHQNADLEILVAAAWGIWNNKNDVRHCGSSKTATVIVNNECRYMEEFRQAASVTVTRCESPQEPWMPPPQAWYKVNRSEERRVGKEC